MPIYGVAMAALVLVRVGVFSLGSALTDDSEGYIGENRRLRSRSSPAPNRPVRAAVAVAIFRHKSLRSSSHNRGRNGRAIQDLTERVAETSRQQPRYAEAPKRRK